VARIAGIFNNNQQFKDAVDVTTSIGLWNFGALHYTPPLRKRKSEGIKKGYLSQTANLLLTLNLIL
jgi:hypothetical protein